MTITNDKGSRILTFFCCCLLLLSLAVLFGKIIQSDKAVLAPDAGVFSFALEHKLFPSSIAGGWEPFDLGKLWPPENIVPKRFLSPLMESASYLLWSYIMDTVFIFIATFLFLRTLKLTTLVTIIGAISMALSTHTLTLISAGHSSKTGMMPFAILIFAALYRAIDKRSLFWFACTGVIAGIAVSEHYDVAYMFCILAAVYGLTLIFRSFPNPSLSKQCYLKLGLGILLAGTFALMSFLPQLQFITTQIAPARDAIVENAKIPDPNEQWKFATSWSLPPEDIIEFVIPGIYGLETGNPKAPYWGRTGQARGWNDHNIQMSLRQHGIYLGLIQVVFAIFAISFLFTSGNNLTHNQHASDDSNIQLAGPYRSNLKFWFIAWITCVILALGQYGPFYWFFFKFFPYGAQIRCPIKFMHLVELATSVLFAFGLQQFMTMMSDSYQSVDKNTFMKALRRITAISLGMLGVIFIILLFTIISTNNLNAYWIRIGMQSMTTQLMDQMIGSELHAILAIGLLIALFFIVRKNHLKDSIRWLTPLAIASLLTIDMCIVARPYIKVDNYYDFFYSRNPLIDRLLSKEDRYRVTPLSGNILYQIQYQSFRYFGINNTFPPQGSSIEPEMKDYMRAIGNNFPRFWQLTSTGYLLAARDILPQLSSLKGTTPELWFSIIQSEKQSLKLIEGTSNNCPFVLIRNQSALPRAAVFYNWQESDRKTILSKIASSTWDPAKTVLVETTNDSFNVVTDNVQETTPALITKYEPLLVEVQAHASREAVLLLNDRYDPHWHVFINGLKQSVLRCNGIMRGIKIPAGNNTVVFSFELPYKQAATIKVCTILFMLVWIVIKIGINLGNRIKSMKLNAP